MPFLDFLIVAFYKDFRILVFFVLFVSFFSASFATYPSFQFSSTNFPPGQVDLSGQVSSGVKLGLYVNSNYVGTQNIIAPPTVVNLTTQISNEMVPIGAVLRFVNKNPNAVFKLNISGFGSKTLNYNQSFDFYAYKQGSYLITNTQTGVQKSILVQDSLTNFNFTNISRSYLVDGNNAAKFILKSPIDNSILDSFNYSFNFQKYTNTISLTNFSSVSNKDSVFIKGVVSDASSPLYYIVNHKGSIANIGLLTPINTTPGGVFNVTISNLFEGNNSIRLITVDKTNKDVFNGEKIANVLVDTQPPTIKVVSATYSATNINGQQVTKNADFSQSSIFMNGNILKLNISTDAKVLNYTLNGKNQTCGKVVNNSVSCQLSMQQGQNNLTLIAIDIAGNIAKQSHDIHFNNQPLSLVTSSLTPKIGSTVHFFLQSIKGQVNRPNVKIEAFSIPQGAQYFYTDAQGQQHSATATCADFKFLGSRSVGSVDYSTVSPQVNPTDQQISLMDLVQNEVTTTSGTNGSFSIDNLILKEKNLNPQSPNSNKVSKVTSPNTICFILSDKYGNIATQQASLTLDQGNTMWIPQAITPTPSTVYAAEIEQTGNLRSGTGNVQVGVIATFHYEGGGTLKDVRAPRIYIDPSINPQLSQYAQVVTSEMNYKTNPNTNTMTVYFPVEIFPMHKKPMNYPKQLKIGFGMTMTYDLTNIQIPIDTANPVYFQTNLNIERPLDSAKWLTPSTINSGISFLNKSIKFTQTAEQYMGYATMGGVLACTAAKFYYGAQIAAAEAKGGSGMQTIVNNLKNKLYHICDRVICSAAPAECSPGSSSSDNYLTVPSSGVLNQNDLSNNPKASFSSGTNKIGEVTSFRSSGQPCVTSTGQPGVISSFTTNILNTSSTIAGYQTVMSQGQFSSKCVAATYSGTGMNSKALATYINTNHKLPTGAKVTGVNLKQYSGVCYVPNAPNFDESRTLGHPGVNPADGLIDSLQSVCFTDAYSQLKKYASIQESIKKCLEQAKIGVVSGSYCERLMSQSVCDLATYTIFKTASQKAVRSNPDPHSSDFSSLVSGASTADNLLNSRYSGNQFYSEAGMGTKQIIKNTCMAAVTGDWSILSQNLLSAINSNQVEPTFGPMYPVSRIQGYNPFTGDLSIRYLFTYAGISGGQNINTKVQLICDKSKPNGQYCPQGIVYSNAQNSHFVTPSLYIAKGDSVQQSIVITDSKARYMFNEVRLTDTYTLNGKTETKTQTEEITPKSNGLLADCHWNGGVYASGVTSQNAGISCNTLFGPGSLVSAYQFNPGTYLSPKGTTTLYPGNHVYAHVNYDVRSDVNAQNGFDLAYEAVCTAGKGTTTKVGYLNVPLPSNSGSMGTKLVDIFTIPTTLGVQANTKGSLYSIPINSIPTPSPSSEIDLSNYDGTNNNYVWLEAVNQNGITGQNFNINNINFAGATTSMVIGQNMVLNSGSKSAVEYHKITINSDYKTLSDFEFKTDSQVPVSFSLVYGPASSTNANLPDLKKDKVIAFNAPSTVTNTNANTDFSNLVPGPCKLNLRILPPGDGGNVNANNFKTYSPTGSNANMTNVNNLDILSTPLSFNIANTPSSSSTTPMNFEVTSPIKQGSLCVDGSNTNSIPVSYLLQTADNKKPTNLKFNVNIAANLYSFKFQNKEISPSLEASKSTSPSIVTPQSVSIIIPDKMISDAKSTENSVTKSYSKSYDMTLSYTLSQNTQTKSGTTTKTIQTKTIPFSLTISNNCQSSGTTPNNNPNSNSGATKQGP